MSRFRAGYSQIFGGLTVDGSWTAGYLGNDKYIPLLGTDFNVRDYIDTGSRPQDAIIEGIYSPGSFVRPAGGTVRNPGATFGGGASYAMKIIPRGYEAYAFIIHGDLGSATPYIVQAYASALEVATVSNLQIAGAAPNVIHNFTGVVSGDGSNYVIIKFEPAHGNDEVYGGQIFIRRKT